MVIDVQGLCVEQGKFSLRDVGFQIETGQYAVLMGRSGCGKTTVMEVLCGLRRPKSGTIRLAGVDVTNRQPGERNIGYVPQDGALFPTMTVADQVAFALNVRRQPKALIRQRVQELANLLGIEHLLDRYPHGLSGGEKQRVALGRALAVRPSILCLDEPLSALDDDTRQELIQLLKDLPREMRVTTLHITHYEREASELADVLLVLKDGLVSRSSD